ncbi:PadR family transcriptional regulator [Candidatus Contubernalis alkaliaceticus]|uniref:PadR family transcriptional regulator n=1 Tax=Candidatus Contubernalis alkaliaceticus TaxID=338645 RepID=UPI001F4C260E|nr:PadR family transcriptional regulator [Candidatus Contubernalis alkalaceticus]UNC93398.1 PadR family transcriptional regulator [Candidatus Contubernalis alkalaceticus]
MGNYLDKSYWNGLLKIGLSRFLILRVLYGRPLHCYVITRFITQLTDGNCSPSEGSLYPVLNDFLSEGYVTCSISTVAGRKRKVYTLTQKGIKAYYTAIESWHEMTRVLIEKKKHTG